MKIVDQKREHIYNFDNCFEIAIDGACICIRATYDSRYKIIGKYDEDRAKEVFDEMLKVAFSEDALIFANIAPEDSERLSDMLRDIPAMVIRTDDGRTDYETIERSVYYMPEE